MFSLTLSLVMWVVFGSLVGLFAVFLNRFTPVLIWGPDLRLALIQGAIWGALCQIVIFGLFFFSDTFILFKYLISQSRNSASPFVPIGALKILLDQTWFEFAQSDQMPVVRILVSSKKIQMRVRAPFRNGEWWISTGFLANLSDAEIQEEFRRVLIEVPRFDCLIQTWAACVSLFWALLGSSLCGSKTPSISSTSHERPLELGTYFKHSWGYIPAVIILSIIHLIRSWVQSSDSNTLLDFNVLDVISSNDREILVMNDSLRSSCSKS